MSQHTTSQTSPLPASEEIRISSVSEFIEKIVQRDKEAGTETFYRGHADKDWDLLPSIFRTPNGVEKEHLLFHDMVAHEPQSFSECKSTLDYLVQMQHYGLPTRLLDMTINPLVALYFACQSVDDVEAGILSGLMAGQQAISDIVQSVNPILEADPMCTVEAAEGILKLADTFVEANPRADSKYLVDLMLELVIQNKGEAMALCGALTIPWVDPNTISMVTAIAGAIAGAGAPEVATRLGALLPTAIMPATMPNTDPTTTSVTVDLFNETTPIIAYEFAATLTSKLAAQSGAELGTKARAKDGIVYLFSVLEDKVKHYDSDTVSVLANTSSEEVFNEQPDIKFLLHQIKGEKPHFLPSIQSDTLSSLFFVKAKNGNQRIANQMGAFLLFGLGVKQTKASGSDGEVNLLTKSEHMEVPAEWIKKKLIIPKECKADILRELALLGITDSYIYPGMEQYAKELKRKYEL